MHAVHIESYFVYPTMRDRRAVRWMWARRQCHSCDSQIVSGFGDSVVGGLWVMVLAALGEAVVEWTCISLGGVRDWWYGNMCTRWCSLSLFLSRSGLRRHAWYCRSACSCWRFDIEVIDPIACDGDWWRWYGALAASKCGCVPGCVQLIDGEKREPERRRVESIDFVLLWNVNESMMAYCDFVIISELNDYWLTKFLHWVECGAVIAHMVRCSRIDDPCSWSRGCGESGRIVGQSD